MVKAITLLVCLLLSLGVRAQGVGVGLWRDHLPFGNTIAVTSGNDVVYCATSSGIFSYDLTDNSIETFSKANLLSEIGITAINYNDYNNMLVVAYENANLDLITDNQAYNLPDIKLKNMIGKKTINDIYFINELAYLSCGFGIIVVDLAKKEIKDTYYIGYNGGHIDVNDITSDGTSLFAATEAGIYQATLSSPNLADYNFWTKHTDIPLSNYNEIEYFNNKIITNASVTGWDTDTLYVYDGTLWSYFDSTKTYNVEHISATTEYLNLARANTLSLYDTSHSLVRIISNWKGAPINVQASISLSGDNYWMASKTDGLIHYSNAFGYEQILPNGPKNSDVVSLTAGSNNDIWVAPGKLDAALNSTWTKGDVYHFIDESWTSLKTPSNGLDTLKDIIHITEDPNNSEKIYVSSWWRGLGEIEEDQIMKVYWDSNSTIRNQQVAPSYKKISVGGSVFDDIGNLWVSNSQVANNLCVKTVDDMWYSFNFGSLTTTKNETMDIISTELGQKWILVPKNGGILVYDDNYTIDNTSDDHFTKLTTAEGSGNLPSNDVICFAEDHDGEIWVGTFTGIVVFYSPELIFSDEDVDYDAEQILIERDGFAENLLESESVTTIAIDGANRKWIGTGSSGVYLMSESGTTEIKHFEVDNSPLLSNTIMDIAISQNGEVFIGTDQGIISYRSDSSAPKETFEDIFAFPNPVYESYTGDIAITGLVSNTVFKITDINGTLIYQADAKGGMGTWNGKTYNGNRVSTGVYLVFATKSDGTQSVVTKILVIN